LGDIAPGDRVITRTGEPALVEAVHEQGELDCVRIRTAAGRAVVAAPDHPFWTAEGWVKAGDLAVGERLASVLRPDVAAADTEPADAYPLAGYLVAGEDDAGHARHLLGGAERRDWLAAHGVDPRDPRVPAFVFRAGAHRVRGFLSAFLVANRPADGTDLVVAPHRDLLADVQHLLLRVGVQSRLDRRAGGGWRLALADGEAHGGLAYDPVTAVDRVGLHRCRCLTVAGDHTFTVDDLVVHNTTLANIVAAELGTGIRVTSGPAIERSGDLAAILTGLDSGDVLFIDEIHRIAKPAEELLYSAMEDFRVDVIVGKGPGATAIPLDVEPFTLIGATTRSGLLTGPMRDRFGFVAHLDFYAATDLETLLHRSARILGVPITGEGAVEIAGRSRGTPRIANRLLRRVRDFAEVRADGVVTLDTARAALTVYDVDGLGLDRLDRAVLTALVGSFRGGPVGLSTLAVAVGEQPDTVEEVCEPFLVRAGLLARTPRGRVATEAAWHHLGRTPPNTPGVAPGPDLFSSDPSAP
jgi:Holliday junction DNA helicase RuvB subunit